MQECIALRRRVAQLTSSASQLDTIRQSAIRLSSSSSSISGQIESFTLQLDSASNLYRARIADISTTLDLLQRALPNPDRASQTSQSTSGEGEAPSGDDANLAQAQTQLTRELAAEESDRFAQLRATENEIRHLESV